MTVRPLQSAWRFSRNELSGKPGAVQAANEVLEKLDTVYYATRLGQIIEAALERGRVEGRAEIIGKQDALQAALKKQVVYRLPGRPRAKPSN